jgi:acyl-CoA synthetase (AMP-forming)/AMP-acid ligase II
VPDPEREGSERVVVFVKPKPGHKAKVTEDGIVKYLSERVAIYAVPKAVGIVDELPLTAVQKVDKKALREIAVALYSRASSGKKSGKKGKMNSRGGRNKRRKK